jgi:hypothetical protein
MKKTPATFFDIKAIVHFEFILQWHTVDEALRVKRLREAVRVKSLNFGSTIGFSTVTML